MFKIFISAILIICMVFSLAATVYAYTEIFGSTQAEITFLSGDLLLNEMPSFSFESQEIKATAWDYKAVENKVYLNVSDLRGTGVGWKITAVGSTFIGPENSLTSAYIELLNGVAVPTIAGNAPPDVEQDILIDMDGAASSKIAEATSGKGLGNWSIEWNGVSGTNENVLLNVPGGLATIGTYTATITWTLANAP